jgi:acetoin utilization deacetylase AcuC-like enzyme
VLDCDQHGGNGTAEFTRRFDNFFNYSIYGLAFGCPTYERSETYHVHKHQNFSQYILAIHQAFQRALDWNADLIIFQAGMDCHQDDPCGSSWFSTELIEKRDEIVFRLAKKHQLPLMFVLAGGYQALPELVKLHVGTFQTAYQTYYAE